MRDVICISSSEDEENSNDKHIKILDRIRKSKQQSNTRKRKLSTSISDDNRSKRSKVDDNETVIDTENCIRSSSSTSSKSSSNRKSSSLPSLHRNSDNNAKRCISPKPGTSKHFDEIESRTSKKIEADKKMKSLSSSASSSSHQSNSIKKLIKPQLVVKEKVRIPDPSEDLFEKFLELLKQRNDDATRKISFNLKRRYDQLGPNDKDSEEFRLILSGSIQKIRNDTTKFYFYIQELVDEIRRRIKKPKIPEVVNSDCEQENGEEEVEGNELSESNMIKVKKLQEAINKCKKRIKELELREVDFDEEEDSAYLQEDRYKRKLVQLYLTLSEIIGDSKLKRQIYKKKIRRKDIPDEMTGIVSVDEAIINFINSGVTKVNKLKHIKYSNAIADYLSAPDLQDIVQCITKCNKEKDIGLTKRKVQQIALTAHKTVIRYLQKQRIKESDKYISSYVEVDTEGDPAIKNNELYEKLQRNKIEGDKKLEEIFKTFLEKEEGLTQEDLQKQVDTDSEDNDETENEITEEDKTRKPGNKKRKRIISSEDEVEEKEKCEVKNKENEKKEEDKFKEIRVNDIAQEDVEMIDENEKLKSKDEEKTSSVDKEDNEDKADNVDKEDTADKEDNADKDDIEKVTVLKNSLEEDFICSVDLTKNSDNVTTNNNVNTLPAEEDNEIEILSDDDDVNPTNKSNSNAIEKSKPKLPVIDDDCILEDDEVENSKENEISNVNSISKQNNVASVNLESVSIEVTRIKSSDNKDLSDVRMENVIRSTSFDKNKYQGKTISKNKNSKNDEMYNSNETSKESIVKNSEKDWGTFLKKDHVNAKDLQKITTEIQEVSEFVMNDNSSLCNKESTEVSLNSEENNKKISDTNDVTIEPEILLKISDVIEETVIQEISKKSLGNVKEADMPLNDKAVDSVGTSKSTSEESSSSSFIKVRSFAKPPDSWKDSLSPVKNKQNFKLPIEQVLKDMHPESAKLTGKNDSRSSSFNTKIINPAAVKRIINQSNVSILQVTGKETKTSSSNSEKGVKALPTTGGSGFKPTSQSFVRQDKRSNDVTIRRVEPILKNDANRNKIASPRHTQNYNRQNGRNNAINIRRVEPWPRGGHGLQNTSSGHVQNFYQQGGKSNPSNVRTVEPYPTTLGHTITNYNPHGGRNNALPSRRPDRVSNQVHPINNYHHQRPNGINPNMPRNPYTPQFQNRDNSRNLPYSFKS